MKIVIYEDRPPAFWALMGPFFAQRRYRREMPYLVDDDGYAWFVAQGGEAVAGFVAVHLEKGGDGVLSGLYVDEARRGVGWGGKLVERALRWCAERGAKKVKTTASQKSVSLFTKMGFAESGKRGQFTMMEVSLDAVSFRGKD